MIYPKAKLPAPHQHRSNRVGWLRAAVLGANDGIISVAGIVVGVAASGASAETILMTGIAAAVTGAISMAAGEYVSVQSQADTEKADIAKEKRALDDNPDGELKELAKIYEERGLDAELALRVARQLTSKNALAAHARDELGLTETLRARPIQAALASAAAFSMGAALPIATILVAPHAGIAPVTTGVTVAGLFLSGALAAWTGGAPVLKGALRVSFWGVLAMLAAHGIGNLFQP